MNPAAHRSTAHVFVDALATRITVSGTDGHHLARVLRVRVGESVTAADGSAAWRPYEVADAVGGDVVLAASGPVVEVDPPATRLTVAFALTKGTKPETTVAHLVELGVDRIIPVEMAHSVVRWNDAKRAAAHERFSTVVREAAMQSRRVALPVVEPVAGFANVLTHPALVVGDASTTPIAAALDQITARAVPEWCAVVGPEGGFAPDERAALLAASPYPPVAIGSNVLRAETAALALATALAVIR